MNLSGSINKCLRPIGKQDLERLRCWKNENSKSFFCQEYISKSSQDMWFSQYEERLNDYMFIVLAPNDDIIGCMGIRWQSDEQSWDIYNVILGEFTYKGSGIMSLGLLELIRFALEKREAPVKLNVLKDNPAIRWYERNGFKMLQEDQFSASMCFTKLDSKKP